jgi:Protein of unknown function (DUF416)
LQNSPADPALSQACIQNAPDTDKFSDELTSYALNATLAMSEIMEFSSDNRTDHLAQVSTLARDSIDAYLSSLEPGIASTPEEDARIACHPLVQQEQGKEEDDIEFLSELPDELNDEVVAFWAIRALTPEAAIPA